MNKYIWSLIIIFSVHFFIIAFVILIPPPTQPPIALCYCDLNHIIIALRYITLVIFYYHYLIFNFMPIIYSALNRGSRVRGNKGNGGKHVLPFFGTAPLAPSISPKCIFCVINNYSNPALS